MAEPVAWVADPAAEGHVRQQPGVLPGAHAVDGPCGGWQPWHEVDLLAPDGRKQGARLGVTPHGIVLALGGGTQGAATIPFATILHWMPAALRDDITCSADCLDLQIRTDAGIRELRLRLASGSRGVAQLTQQMQLTAGRATQSSISMDDSGDIPSVPPSPALSASGSAFSSDAASAARRVAHRASQELLSMSREVSGGGGASGGRTSGPLPAPPLAPLRASSLAPRSARHQPGGGGGSSGGKASTTLDRSFDTLERSFDDSELGYEGVQPQGQQASFGGGAEPVLVVAWQVDERTESLRLSLKAAEGNQKARQPTVPGGRGGGGDARLLRRVVDTLTAERTRGRVALAALAGMMVHASALSGLAGEKELELHEAQEAADSERHIASSVRQMYDDLRKKHMSAVREGQATLQTLAELQEDNVSAAEAAAAMRVQIKELSARAGAAEAAAAASGVALSELQQRHEGTVCDAAASKLASTAMVAAIAEEGARLSDALQVVAADGTAAATELSQLRSSHTDLTTRHMVQATVAAAMRNTLASRVDVLAHESKLYRASLAGERVRTMQALEGQAQLQLDLAEAHHQLEEAAVALRAAEPLRAELAVALARLDAGVLREQELSEQLAASLAEAEAERKGAESLVAEAVWAQGAAESELAVLQERICSVREAARKASDEDYRGRLEEAERAADAARAALADAEAQVGLSELRARVAELAAELEESQAARVEALAKVDELETAARLGKARTFDRGAQTTPLEAAAAVSAAQAAAMAKAAAEAAAAQAQAVAAHAMHSPQPAAWLMDHDSSAVAVDWYKHEVEKLKAEVRELKQRLLEAKEQLYVREQEVVQRAPRLDVADDLEGRLKRETMKSAQLEAAHVREVATLSGRLEAVLTSANRAMEDARQAAAAKDGELARWQAAAQQAGEQSEAARRECAESARVAAALRQQVASLADANAKVSAQLAETQSVAVQMHGLLQEGGTRMVELEQALLASERQGRDWQAEVSYLQRLGRQRSHHAHGYTSPRALASGDARVYSATAAATPRQRAAAAAGTGGSPGGAAHAMQQVYASVGGKPTAASPVRTATVYVASPELV